MLWSASAIKGYAIVASDGLIGTVSDFLFDDTSWPVRWLVVDTGSWLSGRKVLLPLSVLGCPEPRQREFAIDLAMQQVKDSLDMAMIRKGQVRKIGGRDMRARAAFLAELFGVAA